MSKKSIKKNYIYNLLYQVLTLLTPLITTPYLSRVLGANGIGTYSYIDSVCSYFVLFATLGLTTFGQREISYFQEDREKRSIIFWETNLIELIASIVSIIVYVIFSFTQSDWRLYLVLVFNLLAVIFNISWFFQGMEEFGKIVFRNIVFKLLNITFVFLVVKEPDDLIWYLFGTSFFNFLNNVSYWGRINEYVDKPVIKNLHPSRHLKTILSLFLPTIAIQIYTVLDKTMIGVITQDSFENGYYEQALKIIRIVQTLVVSLGAVMIPRIGYYYEKGDLNQVRAYLYKGYRFVLFLGIPLCIGLNLVSYNFVPWFFGSGYDKVESLIGILSLLILAIGINNVTGMQYLIPTKRQNTFTRTVLYGAITNLVLNSILIKHFQSHGAAISSVVAESLIALIQLLIVRKEISIKVILKSGKKYIFSGVNMACVLLIVRRYFTPSIINTFLLTIIGASTYFVSLVLSRDEFLYDNFISIYKRVGK